MSKEHGLDARSGSGGSEQPSAETNIERRKRVAQSLGRLLARHWLRRRSETDKDKSPAGVTCDGRQGRAKPS